EMAIFIASTKSISRGKGQSAVASASYRAGVALEDTRYGKTHDYSKRHGVMSADIILPSALTAANAAIDRSELWNKAESAEKRKDARVAREWLVNLPYELSAEDRKELAHSFAQTLADRYGTIADCAIHEPTQKEIDRGADPRNYHAHIMFTTRTAELDENNEITLTDKATIELSDKKRRSLSMERVSHEIKDVRQLWEQIANEKLAEHDHKLIDSRSYAAQG
ncbi:MobA/MobL family protein, partial [Psychrobacter namhaensis]|uniref:MobA/MobL family protein n=1 Tax=Psychrobacter namhaensis TaxID=292734 RepID=UPI0018693135